MKSARLAALLALTALPACSLLFDGSPYRGGADIDADVTDVGTSDVPLPDGSMPGACTPSRITECESSSQFCDPTTGSCVATCTNSLCAALDPARPICSANACVGCGEDVDCGINGVCESGSCTDCDGDDDGFPRGDGACGRARPALPRDCDDEAEDVYPGAIPTCNDDIDQSCTGGSVAGGLAVEFGRYAPIAIPIPAGADLPSRLRVFMIGPARALAFLAAGDANQTIIVADVDLAAGTVTSSGSLLDILRIDDRRAAQSDAIRLPDRNIAVSMLNATASSAEIRRAEYDLATHTWDASQSTIPLGAADTAGFNQFGDAALVHRADGAEYVVTAARTTSVPSPQLFALRVGTAEVVNIAPAAVVTATRPWIESTGSAAVFASPGGEVRFWAGEAVAGDRTFVAGSATGAGNASTAAAATVRGSSDDERIAILAPSRTSIEAFTSDCSSGVPLAQCPAFMPGANSPASYSLDNLMSPSIAATLVSSTALIVATTRMTSAGPEIGFVVVETGPLSNSLLELPVTVPISGTPRDLAVDALFTPDVDESGTLELAGLYLEEEGPRRSVFLIGARGCIGYEHP